MDTLNQQEEQLLLNSVKSAVDLVDNHNMSTTEALVKVAKDNKLPPGFVKLACAAYNTGRQLAQQKANKFILDKFAEFQLADHATVMEAMQNPVKTASVDVEYSLPPDWLNKPKQLARAAMTKVASDQMAAQPPLPSYDKVEDGRRIVKAASIVQRYRQEHAELMRKESEANTQFLAQLGGLIGYFRKTAEYRKPFSLVEENARTYFDPGLSKNLLDMVYVRSYCKEKRASDALTVQPEPVDLRAEPYCLIANCLKAANDLVTTRNAAEASRIKGATVREEAFRPFFQAGAPLNEKDAQAEKAAGIFGAPAISGAVGGLIARGMGNPIETDDDLVAGTQAKLDDPQHLNELRRIKATTMLTGMMTDEDDPISGHDPDDVLKAYNEISQMAPRTADTPAALRPLLRRRLSGQTEPFEAQQVADLEHSIAGNKKDSIIHDKPNIFS